MASITRFEDLLAWRKARDVTGAIYATTAAGEFVHEIALKDQLRRASVSAMSNIAEGFERGGDREFKQFLALAKGSIGEVRSQLYVALDAGFLQQREFDQLLELVHEVSRLIAGLMRYLSASEYRGHKFKEPDGPVYQIQQSDDDPQAFDI